LPARTCPAQLREVGTSAPGPIKAPHLSAELISNSGTISPGGKTRVALALTLEPCWHVYWVYAGDSGEAPEVQWSAPLGISMEPMQFAAPSRLPLGPLMDYGYEGTAVFPFDVTASSQVSPGVVGLKAHVRWLVSGGGTDSCWRDWRLKMTHQLPTGEVGQIIQFVLEIEKQKGVLRKVRPIGEERYENTAEHSWPIGRSSFRESCRSLHARSAESQQQWWKLGREWRQL